MVSTSIEKPIFFFKKSFSAKGKVGVFASLIIFSFGAMLFLLPFFEAVPRFVKMVLGFLCLVVGVVTLIRALFLIDAKGGWIIKVTDKKFVCQVDIHKSPRFFGEDDSFDVLISDISHIVFESCSKYSADDYCVKRFTIFLTNKETRKLSEESGVDLDKLATVLSKKSVRFDNH